MRSSRNRRPRPDEQCLGGSLQPVLLKYTKLRCHDSQGDRSRTAPIHAESASNTGYSALFTTLVIRKYSSKFTLGEHPVVKFKTASALAPVVWRCQSLCFIRAVNTMLPIALEEAEGWRITDVMVEGVSFVANYRAQFDAQLKKGGSNAVTARYLNLWPVPNEKAPYIPSVLLLVSFFRSRC